MGYTAVSERPEGWGRQECRIAGSWLAPSCKYRAAFAGYIGASRDAKGAGINIQSVPLRVVVAVIGDPTGCRIQRSVSVDVDALDGGGRRAQGGQAVIVARALCGPIVIRGHRAGRDGLHVDSENLHEISRLPCRNPSFDVVGVACMRSCARSIADRHRDLAHT